MASTVFGKNMLDGVRLLSLDAMNTVIKLKQSVGEIYASFARTEGVECSSDLLSEAFRVNFAKMSSAQPCYDFMGKGSRHWWYQLIQKCFENITNDRVWIDKVAGKLYEHFATTKPWRLVDEEVTSILRYVRNCGIRVVIISNFDYRLRSILTGFDVSSLVDLMLLSGETGVEKPDPVVFWMAAKHFNVLNMKEVLHIGDSYEKDFSAARAAGARSLLFTNKCNNLISSENIISSLLDLKNQC
ncbi:hypothetical protein AB6A40_000391 [Gnathostoma spinigerum]|uniref:Haloacid dehalogenase-like hydrolase domain-containing protein 3 n=1 Tax=Gnathostoma spinigerum TaxID=75299 RepID=A0ABD6EAH6_9BILA